MSGETLKVSEIAVLLALMAEAQEVSNVDLQSRYGFTLTGVSKGRLNDLKLVTSRRAGRAFAHELTDQGWARCHEELAAPCPPRAGTAGGALYALLQGLSRYLARTDLSLADVFRREAAPTQATQSTVDVDAAIRAAYLRADRRPGGWVGLVDLRSLLDGHSRDEVDAALIRLARTTGVTVLPEEDQKRLTATERAAAVTISGRAYHYLVIEGA